MTRDVGSIILILIGGALLRITSEDVYLRYVKESLKPWLIASGLILIVLGLLQLADVWRTARRAQASGVPAAQTSHPAPRVAWLLVLPILAIFLIAPPALGAFTAQRQSSITTAPDATAQAPPLPAGDPVALALNDYASRAIWDDGKTLVGRNVSMTGFATPAPHGGWYVTRLTLTCCAADATVTKILVLAADPASSPASSPATNSWVTVVGHWVPGGGTQSETAIAHVQADTVTAIPAPSNAYE